LEEQLDHLSEFFQAATAKYGVVHDLSPPTIVTA
jgi:hypothetical protein